MKLITEYIEQVQTTIEEGVVGTGKKAYYIHGPCLVGESENKNRRTYPMPLLVREATRINETYIKDNRCYGELGHPSGPTINMERVSHMIKELKQDGNIFMGKAKIMDTPYGNIAKNFIDEGARLGVSSRGMGSLKENNRGSMIVQDDFRLATPFDIVADPSAPGAFVNGIMEGREWVWSSQGILEEVVIDSYKRRILGTPRRELQKTFVSVFEDYMNRLSRKF